MPDKFISHAFVLPDQNHVDWSAALRPYVQHVPQVTVVRMPGSGDLNSYRDVSAVNARQMWLDDDPLRYIRQTFPQVVRVDVVAAASPDELAAIVQRRVQQDDRYGEQDDTPHIYERFVLEWMTDHRPLRVVAPFTPEPGTGDDVNMGVDIATSAGAAVIAGAAGVVTRQWAGSNADDFNVGRYVQVTTTVQKTTYRVIYAGLQTMCVALDQDVAIGDKLGEAAGESIKIIVRQDGGGCGYRLPDVVDPMPMLYVTNLRVRPTVDGLRLRATPGDSGEIIGQVYRSDWLIPKEMHARTLYKAGSAAADNRWLRIGLPDEREGYTAGWLLEAAIYERPRLTAVNSIGVNLDQLHPLGKPDPSQLGSLGWVRFGYNVSNNTGSEDIQAAYDRYAPLKEIRVRR